MLYSLQFINAECRKQQASTKPQECPHLLNSQVQCWASLKVRMRCVGRGWEGITSNKNLLHNIPPCLQNMLISVKLQTSTLALCHMNLKLYRNTHSLRVSHKHKNLYSAETHRSFATDFSKVSFTLKLLHYHIKLLIYSVNCPCLQLMPLLWQLP